MHGQPNLRHSNGLALVPGAGTEDLRIGYRRASDGQDVAPTENHVPKRSSRCWRVAFVLADRHLGGKYWQ